MQKDTYLLNYLNADLVEAGCDEAGRGPLAGPVFAAAVILPKDFHHPLLNVLFVQQDQSDGAVGDTDHAHDQEDKTHHEAFNGKNHWGTPFVF